MNDNLELKTLRYLLSVAFLSGSPTSRAVWKQVEKCLLEVAGSLPDEELAEVLLSSSIKHPLVLQYPKSSSFTRSFLLWVHEIWDSRCMTIGHMLKMDENDCMDFEISYNTYFLGDDTSPLTLLESCDGIARGTTGLSSWGAASVLSTWCLNNSHLIKGHILELGAGIGFMASALLSSVTIHGIISYTATDYHPHVLSILHHNLSLIEHGEKTKFSRETLVNFCSMMNRKLMEEELPPGQFREWQCPESLEIGGRTTVNVLQLDWREHQTLPPCDVILASDVVYAVHLFADLVNVLRNGLCNLTSYSSKQCSELIQKNNNANGILRSNSCTDKVAYVACTRRNPETLSAFLSEVTKQNLGYKEVYQSTLSRDEALFGFDESHLPVKIYKITCPPN